MSSDSEVRAGWARHFEAQGLRVLRCVGPKVSCALLTGDKVCPLHLEADLAIYDRTSVTPDLFFKLLRRPPQALPLTFARDHQDPAGRHAPAGWTSLAGEDPS